MVGGVTVAGNSIDAATQGGLSTSFDGGLSFTNSLDGGSSVISVYDSGNSIYAAAVFGLGISTDGGSSFSNYSAINGPGSNAVLGVYVDGSTLLAATNGA